MVPLIRPEGAIAAPNGKNSCFSFNIFCANGKTTFISSSQSSLDVLTAGPALAAGGDGGGPAACAGGAGGDEEVRQETVPASTNASARATNGLRILHS